MDYSIVQFLTLLGFVCSVVATLEDDGNSRGSHRRSHKKLKQHSDHPKEHKDTKNYFQDIYVAQLVPDEKEFGHVFEDPLRWEQRFEKIHLDNNRHQGKVKWGDEKGGYGEFYFDFNHGGDDDNSEENKDGKNEDKHEHNKKEYGNNIDVLHERHLSDEVEVLPGYKLDDKAPLHGGNYRKLE